MTKFPQMTATHCIVASPAIVDALSDPKKFLTIAEKRADQMKALGIDTVNTHALFHINRLELSSLQKLKK